MGKYRVHGAILDYANDELAWKLFESGYPAYMYITDTFIADDGWQACDLFTIKYRRKNVDVDDISWKEC